MKKNYAILASALLLSFAGFSQDRVHPNEAKAKLSVDESFPKKSTPNLDKSYGDTLAYFDFGQGLPPGWTVYDNANLGYVWTWSTNPPRGYYTNRPGATSTDRIQSTTGANGFMMLESDYYNANGGNQAMDSYFESGPIVIQPKASVLLRFQQFFRYCCSGSAGFDVEVRSNVHPTWDTISVKEGTAPNNATPNPMFTEVNISKAAANADTIYFRFHQSIASHYFWMIDDIAIVEGPAYDMLVSDFSVNYHGMGNSNKRQFYEQVPLELFDSMWVNATVINNGGNIDSGKVVYEVFQDTNCFGTAGAGSVAYVHEDLPSIDPLFGVNVRFEDPFLPSAKGQYTIHSYVQSANVDQVGSNNILSNTFIVSDTVYAKDDGTPESTIGPHNYVGFDHDGATLFMYYEAPKKGGVATSLSYYLAGSRSIGASFTPQLWGFDTTITGCNNNWANVNLRAACFSPAPVAASPFPIPIDSNNINTWVTVPINPTPLTAYPAYAVAFVASGYQHDGNGAVTVGPSVGSDWDGFDQGANNGTGNYDLNVMLGNSARNDFGTAGGNAMMRINFGQLSDTCFLVGIEETSMKADFSIYPNPSNGNFNLKISTEMSKDFTLTITNMIGQNVYTEEISVNNEVLNKNMNFSHLEKGIYFVTLQNATERHTQKIVIR